MRIAHVVWGMKTGGVETMLVNIINEQVKTEKVRLFIVNDFIDEFVVEKISPKCKIVRLNRQPKQKDYPKIMKLNLMLLMFRPDIIHIHSRHISKILFGKWNMVRTIHNPNNVPYEYPKMKALYAISDTVREVTIKQGFPHVKTIYNGISTANFKMREGEAPKNGYYNIVQVSRLRIRHKGQDVLLNAISQLLSQGIKNFELHLIGKGESEQELRQMTAELNLNDYVSFEGVKTQEYLYQHLCDYDLFVQPSRYEGFGLTVAEAMAAKLPVIVSDIQGPMEVIGYGQYGLSFKSGDAADLAEKLKTVLQGGYDYSLIDKAYEHVQTEYDVSITAQHYLQEYQKVINKDEKDRKH